MIEINLSDYPLSVRPLPSAAPFRPLRASLVPSFSKPCLPEAETVNSDTTDAWLIKTPQSTVSDFFVKQLQQGWDSLPPRVREVLVQAGCKIKVAQFLTEAAPHLKKVAPRGGDAGTTADNRSGVCQYPTMFLSEFEWLAHRTSSSKFATSKSYPRVYIVEPPVESEQGRLARACASDRTVRHETGHALDHYLKNVSESRDFKQAYAQDLEAMDEARKAELYYYIQPDQDGLPTMAGRSEAFAEALASLHGGGCNQT